MHRKHALQWQKVIQNRKDGFFNFTRIGCVADDGKFLFKRQADERIADCAIHCGHTFKGRHCNDRKLGHKAFVFLERLRQDEHVTRKVAMPRKLGHNTDR